MRTLHYKQVPSFVSPSCGDMGDVDSTQDVTEVSCERCLFSREWYSQTWYRITKTRAALAKVEDAITELGRTKSETVEDLRKVQTLLSLEADFLDRIHRMRTHNTPPRNMNVTVERIIHRAEREKVNGA